MVENNRLGTMEGVYVPTVLTILGVIMYLRLGWVVGNAGLLGALSIIVFAHLITFSTTLSMASMLTNIKVGEGGAYSIISQSLGLEMGGAIGIPLYFSQAISVAFYITGFTELWSFFFPTHPLGLIALFTWGILAGLSMFSAKLAFRAQYLVLAAVLLSILSFLAGGTLGQARNGLVGSFLTAGYWQTFAIFFPAVTGILTGASMSGELADPRRSIVRGTIAAVFTGFILYGVMAWLFYQKAPSQELLENNLVILDLSYFKIFVIMGIMGAVLSSALSTLVSAPRTLAALAGNRSFPFYAVLSKKAANGEPRNAIIVSSILSLTVLLAGNLDGLASLLTLFFLTTYAMINLVVFIEKITGIVSFRPSLNISMAIPVIGLAGCLFSMFLINTFFVLITFFVVAVIYYSLQKKRLTSANGDVRGGIFYAIADWAAQKAMALPYHPKMWKPSVLIPVETPEDFKRITSFIKSLISPSGRVYYLTIRETCEGQERVREVLEPLKEDGLFAHEVLIEGGSFSSDLSIVIQSLRSTFLPPNCIFFTISNEVEKQHRLMEVLNQSLLAKMGLLCLHIHPRNGFGQSRHIHLWLRDKSPNHDLAVLSAIQLSKNWNARITLCRVVAQRRQLAQAERELAVLIEDARLPVNTNIMVKTGEFEDIIQEISTDLHILGMPTNNSEVRIEYMQKTMNLVQSSVLFVTDSGLECAVV